MMHNKEELIAAAHEGDVEKILDVLEDIHERNCHDETLLKSALDLVFGIRDDADNTLLHIAAGKGHDPVLDALLRHGFSTDTISSGSTALHRAVEGDHFSCVKCLVLYGALILKDNEGYTPIDISRKRDLSPIVSFFDAYPRTRQISGLGIEQTPIVNNVPQTNKKRLVVGVSGATCSGKSTLTRSLVKHFACKEPFHHMDTYWKEYHHFPRDKGFVVGERPDCLHMDLFTDELKRRRTQGEDDILFVDGFLLLHSPEVCDLLDLKIFLQISEPECRKRRKSRNPGTSKAYYEKVIWPSYVQFNSKYAQHPVGLMDETTLILDGEKSKDEILRDAIQFIEAKLKNYAT